MAGCSGQVSQPSNDVPIPDSSVQAPPATPSAAPTQQAANPSTDIIAKVSITDPDGYTATLDVQLSVAPWVKSIVDARPGFANASANAQMTVRLTNTTAGRDATMEASVGSVDAAALYPTDSAACQLTGADHSGLIINSKYLTADGKYCIYEIESRLFPHSITPDETYLAPHNPETNPPAELHLSNVPEGQLASAEKIVVKPYAVVILLNSAYNKNLLGEWDGRPDWQAVGGTTCLLNTNYPGRNFGSRQVIGSTSGFSCSDL